MTSTGFPHSDTFGSTSACDSPKLFAASCVLHRFLAPRHSPCALSSLTIINPLSLYDLQVEGQSPTPFQSSKLRFAVKYHQERSSLRVLYLRFEIGMNSARIHSALSFFNYSVFNPINGSSTKTRTRVIDLWRTVGVPRGATKRLLERR